MSDDHSDEERSDEEERRRDSDDEWEGGSSEAGGDGWDEEYQIEDWATNVRGGGREQNVSQHRGNDRGPGAPLRKPLDGKKPKDGKDSKKNGKDSKTNGKDSKKDRDDQSKDSGKGPQQLSKK
ncbi:hypothetical protein NEOLEDRAFT_1244200 [Neolentinus lepideus HHB14362 ss-1]|uniref:Uncharacterized protein n=1 Tax=Neolentinus lepideus HHB14362 ss-1 TaxID=1314782 RepID=A0A165Q7W0_9AGAM|nr:hypothetical protein NEOLEDRAFT_1244200 [Neolentinus lepideus HHB14362 ss-1]